MTILIFSALSLGFIGLIFGLVLQYASKKFHVEVDERIPLVRECLPGANCGGCGFAGCDAYAEAVVNGVADPSCCAVAGKEGAKKIGEILGISVNSKEPLAAFVKCSGTCETSKFKGIYHGELDCNASSVIPGGGSKGCSYACLGLGSCIKACKFDAITIESGVAKVDPNLCTACGACTKTCPRGVIELKPIKESLRVYCSSKDKLKEVKDVCSSGCLTCGQCVRNCPNDAITFSDNLPVINKEKCTNCMTCIEKCPTKVLKQFNYS